jgi:hypothetical protein
VSHEVCNKPDESLTGKIVDDNGNTVGSCEFVFSEEDEEPKFKRIDHVCTADDCCKR